MILKGLSMKQIKTFSGMWDSDLKFSVSEKKSSNIKK